MKDTAYTSLALPAHTDTTYFTDPAGLQMFHLLSHTEGKGGSSLLVDGFEVARLLRTENLEAYRVLRDTPIQWHASGNEGITITPSKKFPVLNFGNYKKGTSSRELMQIRWNNDDRGVVDLFRGLDKAAGHVITADRWYWAARKWDEILRRKSLQYWAQLEPGRPLSMFLTRIKEEVILTLQFLTIGEFCMEDLLSLGRGEFVVVIVTVYDSL